MLLPVHGLDFVPGRQIGPVNPDKPPAQLPLQVVEAAHEVQAAVRRVEKYVVGLGGSLKKQDICQGDVAGLVPGPQGS